MIAPVKGCCSTTNTRANGLLLFPPHRHTANSLIWCVSLHLCIYILLYKICFLLQSQICSLVNSSACDRPTTGMKVTVQYIVLIRFLSRKTDVRLLRLPALAIHHHRNKKNLRDDRQHHHLMLITTQLIITPHA